MKTARALACGLGLMSIGAGAAADVRTVGAGQPYPTIQAAINAASSGDTVLVHPGTYTEAIDFLGKAITVRGRDGADKTIISGGMQTVILVRFVSGETAASVLQGFTIAGTEGKTGARGMEIVGASPRVLNCIFRDHIIDFQGGGARVNGGSPLFVNCLFTGIVANQTSALHASGPGTTQMINCTLTGNSAFNTVSGTVAMTNSIVWGNQSQEFLPGVAATYSNIEYIEPGAYPGIGNIEVDPLLTETFMLGPGSPCIDAGNSSAFTGGTMHDLGDTPRGADVGAAPDTGAGPWPIIDMGAYEVSPNPCLADIDANSVIDSNDISAYLTVWLEAIGLGCP